MKHLLSILSIILIITFVGCEESDNGTPTDHPNVFNSIQSYVDPDPHYIKKGKGKGKGQLPNTTPQGDQLAPIFYGDIDIQWTTNGNGSVITWDAMPNSTGYQIMIYDNCYCYTTQVDSIAIPGETYYLKYLNATNEEAWMGYLNEIGKDRWYQIRIRSWALVGTDWQPYISDMDSIYVD